MNRILNTIGASKNFVLAPCDKINNAVATAYKGTRYILYDKEFMNMINRNTNDWSNLFVLAHEVGHHINGHSIDVLLYTSDIVEPKSLAKKREQELEADEFAAFVLAKLGANLSQLNNVITLISNNSDDTYSTHPKRSKRLASVKNGFNKGYIKRETKTVYIKESNIKYDKNQNYSKYGSWYLLKNNDPFNDDKKASVVAKIYGNSSKKWPISLVYEFKTPKKIASSPFSLSLEGILNIVPEQFLGKITKQKNIDIYRWKYLNETKSCKMIQWQYNGILLKVNMRVTDSNGNIIKSLDPNTEIYIPVIKPLNYFRMSESEKNNIAYNLLNLRDYYIRRKPCEKLNSLITAQDLKKGTKLIIKLEAFDGVINYDTCPEAGGPKDLFSRDGFPYKHVIKEKINTAFDNIYFEFSLNGSTKAINEVGSEECLTYKVSYDTIISYLK